MIFIRTFISEHSGEEKCVPCSDYQSLYRQLVTASFSQLHESKPTVRGFKPTARRSHTRVGEILAMYVELPAAIGTDSGANNRYFFYPQSSYVQVESLDGNNNDAVWRSSPAKRDYQHIWRTIHQRMPIYNGANPGGMAVSRRSIAGEMDRARANSLYRLGK